MRSISRAAIVLAVTWGAVSASGCGGHQHHRYYRAPPPPLAHDHLHRLGCGHLVECRYRRGEHHFTPHYRHDRYWHVHRTPSGRHIRCYVERNRHGR